MKFPINLNFAVPTVFGNDKIAITIHSGLTILLGPNGSGKSQVLRIAKNHIPALPQGRITRYLSAVRLAELEEWRSDRWGDSGDLRYDDAHFGGKVFRDRRHGIETATGDFHTLSVRPDLQIKVGARLSALFGRTISIEWDAGNLQIYFSRINTAAKYSAAREASGLLNVVAILSALYDNAVGALLLDEPEVSLHPQLQAFLLKEILAVAGDPADPTKKLVLIATHSPEMVKLDSPEDLTQIVFLSEPSVRPLQVPGDAPELKNKAVRSLLARIGQSHKNALFATRPLLVEGPSDAIIANALDHALNLHLAGAGCQVLAVIGKGEMAAVTKLMRLAGKLPVILGDLDGFIDGPELSNLFAQDQAVQIAAQEAGHSNIQQFLREVRNDTCDLIDENWEQIASYAEKHSYWVNRETDAGTEIQAKRRAALAVLLSSSMDEVIGRGWNENWQSIYRRTNSLFVLLEKAGCFFLRRGAIESYYQFSDPGAAAGKPSAAAAETEHFAEQPSMVLTQKYGDIVRALEFAANKPVINEADAVTELALSVLAPALAKLSPTTTDNELKTMASNILGERASLFSISKLTSDDGVFSILLEMDSQILNVGGFPLKIRHGANVVEIVKRQIHRKS